MTYSLDFRKKVLELKEKEKISFLETSERFGICISSILRWTKNICVTRRRHKIAKKIPNEALMQDVEAYPDSYNHERAKRLGASASGIRDALKRIGVTFKKNTLSSQGQSRRTAYLPGEDRSL